MKKDFKNIGLNVGIILAIAIVLMLTAFGLLGWYTKHNVTIAVPNVVGMAFDEAKIKLESAGLSSKIIDSVYNEKAAPFSIVEQLPAANENVKPERIVFLVINTGNKPKVKMPKLVDMSLTLAKAVLKNRGLTLGNISFTYDEIGNNLVVNQNYRGESIEAGKMIPTGSSIDLVVASTDKTRFPDSDSTDLVNDEAVSDDLGK